MRYAWMVGLSMCLCVQAIAQLPEQFVAADQPPAPDYSLDAHWSALPFHDDTADEIPKGETWVHDSLKQVDVFYVHPTIYWKGDGWCAAMDDKKVNRRVDKFPVKYQASIFNQVGRVYAPRYRQAIIKAFSDSTGVGEEALEFAYADVKASFEYYLAHYNAGRPIILVSHSQGTRHCRQLMAEYFDTPARKAQLVCAYVVGFAIDPNQYETLTLCQSPDETNCYCTWATIKEGEQEKADESKLLIGKTAVNPICWTTDTTWVESKGSVMLNIQRKKPFKTRAQLRDNVLWAQTNMPFVRGWEQLHFVDFNLFWYDIRDNVVLRVQNYFERNRRSAE